MATTTRAQVNETKTQGDHGRPETVWELIEAQAEAKPGQTAILDGETEIDYERLVERASAMAGELAARGVEPGSLVGVCLDRTWELVATLVGILRAGCAYVPLDPAYPRERVRYMLEHSRAAVAIVDDESRAALCEGVPEIVRLDEVNDPAAGNALDGRPGPSPDDLAYVLYTSGSTGRPKGVAVEHRSVAAMCRASSTFLDEEDLSGVLAAASICFDASVLEILGTLCLGGTVVLAENVLELLDLPSADRVRTCIMVPSSMRALLAAGALPSGVRCVVLGGEVLEHSLLERLHAHDPTPRVMNVYGPTEDTVYSTKTEVPVGAETITIGTPVPGSRSYILDEGMQPVPAGTTGELYLAGDQLARGYLHDEELTNERFVTPDPSGPITEERLYQTGDLCRWREDGEIEFLGRKDQQVKIRGFRIELEEIESALRRMEGVEGAAVGVVEAVAEGVGDRKELVAYVVSADETVSREAVRSYLAERLPGYMVPGVVVHLEELPLMPNGKLDRQALPKPESGRFAEDRRDATREDAVPGSCAVSPSAAPSDGAIGRSGGWVRHLATLSGPEAHGVLLSIIRGEIASLLRMPAEEVSADTLLYDLGLDSLTTVELSLRLGTILDRKLPLSAVTERSTPATLADSILDSVETAPASAGSSSAESSAGPSTASETRRDAPDMLGSFQAQIRTCHPPFLAAKAPSWSATDKGLLVRELKRLVGRPGLDPFSKMVRTGSAHRGIVADTFTREEREVIIWTTNLYLGLNRDPDVIEAAGEAVKRLGTGMGTSAAAAGVTDLHLEFETGFAELVGKPAACLFPTGYTANLGAVAGLLGSDDVVVMDQLCHASIVDGARLSNAKIRTYRHNDASDLERVLEAESSPYRTTLVVFEGVYSMGEGAAPVAEMTHVAKKYGALVLVDEAHSFGFYGPRGAGICADQGVTEEVDFIMTTLSKALGSLGGVVAAREEHVALLKSSSRAFIFQASTSPADMAAAVAALHRLSTDDSLRERLWDTTAYMRKRFSEAGYDLGTGDGPIVTPHFSDKDKLFAIVNGMFERGVCTSAVTYPIVEAGRGRLRFICSAAHSRDDVDKTLEALVEAEREADAELQSAELRAAQSRDAESKNRAPGLADLEKWADAFSAYLDEIVTAATRPTPSLALSVALAGAGEPIEIAVDGRDVLVGADASGAGEGARWPTCSLRLTDDQAVTALCSSDVQGLLHGILRGGCEMHGQVEPFIWLVGRMVEQRRSAPA